VVDKGEEALKRLGGDQPRYDLVILDVMLPGVDGFQVVTELRRTRRFVPVLMLTARGRSEDVLKGFGAGADDYLPKPFELPILMSRVHGLLRRHEWFREQAAPQTPSVAAQFAFRDRSIDFENLEVRVGEKRMPLTLMEAALLRYFVQHEGSPVPRASILEEVWGLRDDTDTRAIDNFVVRLRRYIEDDPTSPKHLQTIRGVGYRFVANPK
jgi:DNA-binding response OmpR family regulator